MHYKTNDDDAKEEGLRFEDGIFKHTIFWEIASHAKLDFGKPSFTLSDICSTLWEYTFF